MPAADGARRLGVLLPALVGWGWVEALSSLQQRGQLLWKGGFDGSVYKYQTAGEGLACALASPGSSGA